MIDNGNDFQRAAQVRIAGVLIRNAVDLQDIGHLKPGYGTKAETVAAKILANCYPDEDTFDPNTAGLIRKVKDLQAENAALWEFVLADNALCLYSDEVMKSGGEFTPAQLTELTRLEQRLEDAVGALNPYVEEQIDGNS